MFTRIWKIHTRQRRVIIREYTEYKMLTLRPWFNFQCPFSSLPLSYSVLIVWQSETKTCLVSPNFDRSHSNSDKQNSPFAQKIRTYILFKSLKWYEPLPSIYLPTFIIFPFRCHRIFAWNAFCSFPCKWYKFYCFALSISAAFLCCWTISCLDWHPAQMNTASLCKYKCNILSVCS